MVPVILVLIIHSIIYISGTFGTLLPLRSTHPLVSTVLLVIFHFVFFMTISNYALLVLADPGSVPEDWRAPPPSTSPQSVLPLPLVSPPAQAVANFHEPPSKVVHIGSTLGPQGPNTQFQSIPSVTSEPSEIPNCTVALTPQLLFTNAHLMYDRTNEGHFRYCNVCRSFKPDRSHHCSVCRRCILKMDHHCIFVNNCISFYNHKFFIAFITYALVGCLMVTIVTFPTFRDIISRNSNSHILSDSGFEQLPSTNHIFHRVSIPCTIFKSTYAKLSTSPPQSHSHFTQLSAAKHLSKPLRSLVLIGYVAAGAFSFALTTFVALHFYLVSKGRTTIEMHEMTDPARAPRIAQYDLGLCQNVKSVCGTVPFCWVFPTRAYIEGDGISYPRRASYLDTADV